jgi:glyoxalase family protein
MNANPIAGIHHITAIASAPQQNLDFYTQVLGLRLLKVTVNFDDPGSYHFYFGNHAGSPGSVLTFFPWPGAPRGTVGNGQVSATTFAVRPGALEFWRDRLREQRIPAEDPGQRFGEAVLRCVDPDGMPLELVGTSDANPDAAYSVDGIPQEYAICGFHSATLLEEGYESTAHLLQDVMGLRFVGQDENRFRYAATGSGSGRIVDVVCSPDGRRGRLGAGIVHHIAWRTSDATQQKYWRDDLVTRGFNVSPIMDRVYFRSIYFREPGGILFEIATDGPGFAADEPPDHLGERLALPAWLEPRRTAIEQALPSLALPHAAGRQLP